jgi:proteasome lid subunit RPN8/RPN11
LTDVLDQEKLVLVGQVHGHPGEFIDLSEVDRAMGFRVPGFLSIVAPYYGTRRDTPLDQCGFHEFGAGAQYHRLSRDQVGLRIRPVETAVPEPLIIGAE